MFSDRNIGIIGLVLAVFSTAFAVWAYVDTRQYAQITYNIEHETLYRPSKAIPTSLKITQSEASIPARVTQSVATIWNGGNVPFKGEDTRTKLTISGDSSVEILSAETQISKTLPGSSGFNVSWDKRSVIIDWRVFDPGEGLQIVLLTTGNAVSLDLSGRFLPGQGVVRGPIKSFIRSIALIFVCAVGAIVLLLFLVEGVPAIRSILPWRFIGTTLSVVAFLVLVVMYGITAFRVIHYARSYVGDVSPIDPYISYIDVDRNLDYRYAPM